MVKRPRHPNARMNFVHPLISILLPIRMKCNGCNHILMEGRSLRMHYEKLGGTSTKIGARVHRFYTKCPECNDLLIIRTHLTYTTFVCEHGCQECPDVELDLKEFHKKNLRSMDPFKILLKSYMADRPDHQELADSIEKHLLLLRQSEESGVSTRHQLIVNHCNEIREELNKGCSKTPLVKDDGETRMSPFIKKLTRVQSKDLESFIQSIREVLFTRMFRASAFGFEERLQPILARYAYHLDTLKMKKDLADDVVDLRLDDEPEKVPFEAVVEMHAKKCIPRTRTLARNPSVKLPFSMRCARCKHGVPKGFTLPMQHEILGNNEYSMIRVVLYRSFFHCPKCNHQCIIRSNLLQTRFIREWGVNYDYELEEVHESEDTPAEDRGLDMMTLLKPYQRSVRDPNEDGVVQAIEDYLDLLNWASLKGRQINTILMNAVETEIKIQEDAHYIPCLFPKTGSNVKFSDTLLALPEFHFARFLVAIRNELVAFETFGDGEYGETPVPPPSPNNERVDEEFTTLEAPCANPQIPDKPIEIFDVTACRSDLLPSQMMIVPASLKCQNCSNNIYKGQRLEMRQEWLKGLRGLPVNIYRLYMRCPKCTAHITLRSELIDKTYRPEYGAIRVEEEEETPEESKMPAFNPMNLIGRWPEDSADHQEKMRDLEEKINIYVLTSDDSEIVRLLRERIQEEVKTDPNPPPLTTVAMPDASSTKSPFVSYFIASPLTTADLYLMRRQLRTEEFKRVRSEKLPPKPSAAPVPLPQTELKDLLARFCPSPSNQYENLFKAGRRRDTELRRVELVERKKKMLEEKRKQRDI